ncbi:battenin isoform X2 [Petromyzon marinus]|uniref:Battenin n=1 Tax=Petromyzon marinus TaxID=7757 RepID=A0AAJ7U817_PETMA|nr:battenin isoform X2 [Petromyzon marinus]
METLEPHGLDAEGTETLPAASDAANGTETLPGVSDAEIAAERKRDWRNFAGFWILGLTNNFAYVVMLSAAHDILKQQEAGNNTHTNSSSSSFMHDTSPATHTESWELISSNRFDCNPNSTAVILLADILPTLLIKSTAPLFIHRIAYRFRVVICVLTAAASFLIVALSSGVIMSIIGVTFASISSGLGELTFLSLTAHFKSSVLRFWSSGTGAAGLAGSLSYLGFTQAGLSPSATLFIMLFVPPLMAASYWLLLVFPPGWSQRECGNSCSLRPPAAEESQRPLLGADSDDLTPDPNNEHYGLENDILSFKDKWLIVKSLLRFTIPLAVVYFAEYFINQGLFELLYFPNYYLSHGDQYRWYQATYQFGVFMSRSSAQWVRISRTWILALLQVINLIVFFFLVFFTVLPTFWLALPIILWEGLLGGAAYVNTFLNISAERDKRRREFSLGVASVADTLGIALSGATAIPLHDYLCAL